MVVANMRENLKARLAWAATGSGSNSNTDNHGEMDETAMYLFYSTQGLLAPSILSTTILPLHITALHGVSHTTMKGLCHAYPEGAVTPMITPLH